MKARKVTPFVTTDAEAAELEQPTAAELERVRVAWQARVTEPLAGLLDARLAEFINDDATNPTERAA